MTRTYRLLPPFSLCPFLPRLDPDGDGALPLSCFRWLGEEDRGFLGDGDELRAGFGDDLGVDGLDDDLGVSGGRGIIPGEKLADVLACLRAPGIRASSDRCRIGHTDKSPNIQIESCEKLDRL